MATSIAHPKLSTIASRSLITCWVSNLSGTSWLALLCSHDLTEDFRFLMLAGALVVVLCFATVPLVLLVVALVSRLGARRPDRVLGLAGAALGIAMSSVLTLIPVGQWGQVMLLSWPCLAAAGLIALRTYRTQPDCGRSQQAAPLLTRWRPRTRRKALVFQDSTPLGSGW